MTDDEFRGIAPQSEDEWRRFHRMLHEHERARPVIMALVAVVEGSRVVRAVLPYALAIGAMLLAYLNRSALFGVGG